MLKACLNGGRNSDAHTAVPVTPAELAADAARCASLGVAAVHVHPRHASGVESLRPEVIADALTAIRAARPGLPVGVSTGAWIEPDPAARVADSARILAALPSSTGAPAGSPSAAHSPQDAVAPPVLLRAEGPATWAVLAEAVSRGLHTRVGLEDTLLLPDGTPAPGNAALVTAALAAGAR
ncbi:3-keto-5-aminohexanoate cleavage protein [Micromonospora zamorensis]|uniref:3-keto-5-aminohexanoate cleavage protein n=1 Tax=Micromonospora zamorensis TaxID=709883 RepID=UPI0033F6B4DC